MQSSGIGGFILMGANIPADESALRSLTAALTVDPASPPVIAIDQEGGDVSRLPWDDFPAARTLKDAPPAAAEDAFAARGALVRRAGIGVNFGIVADETGDSSSFIYRRALGTTPESAAERVAAAVQGEGPSAFSTLKHFPGHGAAPGDSHSTIPSTAMPREEWRASDGVPFVAGVDAGAPLLMFGHLVYSSVDPAPASLSPEWHRVARDDLGFDGVIVTDDLGMLQASGLPQYADPVANAVAALTAGNDLVLTVVFSTPDTAVRTVDGIVAAVESGSLPAERLQQAAERVAALRLTLAAEGRGLTPCGECAPAE
jgi:beta-N-acetylhexosaminidase